MQKRSEPIQMTSKTNQAYNDSTTTMTHADKQNDSSDEHSMNNSSVASTPSDTTYYLKLKSAVFAPSNASNNLTITSTFNEIPPFISLLCNEFANLSPNTNQNERKPDTYQLAKSPPPPTSTIEQNMEPYNKPSEITPQADEYVYIESVSKSMAIIKRIDFEEEKIQILIFFVVYFKEKNCIRIK
jgi:hypothetical protein